VIWSDRCSSGGREIGKTPCAFIFNGGRRGVDGNAIGFAIRRHLAKVVVERAVFLNQDHHVIDCRDSRGGRPCRRWARSAFIARNAAATCHQYCECHACKKRFERGSHTISGEMLLAETGVGRWKSRLNVSGWERRHLHRFSSKARLLLVNLAISQ